MADNTVIYHHVRSDGSLWGKWRFTMPSSEDERALIAETVYIRNVEREQELIQKLTSRLVTATSWKKREVYERRLKNANARLLALKLSR